ncbi:MAG: molybdopterin oxidoreductase [Bdellovibrionales bacterium]
MAIQSHGQPQAPGSLSLSPRLKTVCAALIAVGLLILVGTIVKNPARGWHSFVVGYFYFTSLALGGLFFTAIQHLTKAGWSVNVRRLAESFTAFLPFAAIGAVLLFVGGPKLYLWFNSEAMAADPILHQKVPYLNKMFFAIRLIVFFGLWMWFAKVIVGRSLQQDKTGDEQLTHKQVGTSIAFIMVFALSYSFFSVDAVMSLAPKFFSTIFGVYCFAGLFQATIATMILTIGYLRKKGKLEGFVNENHMHDLGKFLFAFTVFWAYIAFSQYMLIWYANLPEETFFFMPRLEGSWAWVSAALLLLKFVVPFLALLPQWAKRSYTHLMVVSVWVLVMQFLDIYWLVYPNYNAEQVIFGLPEIAGMAFCGGLFLLSMMRFLSQNSVVAIKDPRIHESLGHHVVY